MSGRMRLSLLTRNFQANNAAPNGLIDGTVNPTAGVVLFASLALDNDSTRKYHVNPPPLAGGNARPLVDSRGSGVGGGAPPGARSWSRRWVAETVLSPPPTEGDLDQEGGKESLWSSSVRDRQTARSPKKRPCFPKPKNKRNLLLLLLYTR